MGDEAVGVGEFPRGEGVGGKALVEDGEVAFKVRVAEVGVEGGELPREEHSLVGDEADGEGGAIESGGVAGDGGVAGEGVFHSSAGGEEFALQFVGFGGGAGGCEELSDDGPACADFVVDGGVVDGDVAPGEDLESAFAEGAVGGGFGALSGVVVLGEEHRADGVLSGGGEFDVSRLEFGAEEFVRGSDEDSGAVAGGGVGADGAAVGEVAEDFHRELDDAVGGGLFEARDEPDAAGVMLGGGVVESVLAGEGDHLGGIIHNFLSSGTDAVLEKFEIPGAGLVVRAQRGGTCKAQCFSGSPTVECGHCPLLFIHLRRTVLSKRSTARLRLFRCRPSWNAPRARG